MLQGRWDLKLDRFKSRIGEKVTQKAVRITQHLVTEFVDRSPVLTGKFRRSWGVYERVPHFYKAEGGTAGAPLPAPNIQVSTTTVFPVFYITNGQPYAKKLEYGASNQAPYGIVRVTIGGMK